MLGKKTLEETDTIQRLGRIGRIMIHITEKRVMNLRDLHIVIKLIISTTSISPVARIDQIFDINPVIGLEEDIKVLEVLNLLTLEITKYSEILPLVGMMMFLIEKVTGIIIHVIMKTDRDIQ